MPLAERLGPRGGTGRDEDLPVLVNPFGVPRYLSTKVVLFPLLAPKRATKICLDFCPACLSRPIGWRSPPEDVLQIQSGTAFDEEPDYFLMAGPCSFVQRGRV